MPILFTVLSVFSLCAADDSPLILFTAMTGGFLWVDDGCVLWKVDLNPSALLLEGANYVEKDFDGLVL